MRKLASIQTVTDVKSIPGADFIVAYKVQGWWVIGKKDEFAVGEPVVYFQVDSWIPTNLAPFLSKGKEPREYNGVKGEKLRTMKMKGQLSQGLILQLEILPSGDYSDDQDVTEILNVQKWEMPDNAQLGGQTKGTFPSFIPKTDQERIQTLGKTLDQQWSREDDEWMVEEKMEGSSCTIFYFEGEAGVCSRNQELKDEGENTFWKVAKKYDVIEKLTALGRNIAIQGELVGPGVQGNHYGLTDHDLFVFDIYDIDKGEYLCPAERNILVNYLELNPVPSVGGIILKDTTVDMLIEMADGYSVINGAKRREGLVFKKHNASFKSVSNAYLLGEK